MAIAKEIAIRYRAPGHVRFQLPAALCSSPTKEQLVTELRRIEGVYRVDLYPRQKKLSIRFIETICDFPALSQALYRLVGAAHIPAPVPSCCAESEPQTTGLSRRLPEIGPVRWLRSKWREGGETATAMGIVARQRIARPGSGAIIKESTVIEFLNDALVLYLIKLHWHMITQHWLRQPWRYRYEWLAVFYLIYLLVRSRRPKK